MLDNRSVRTSFTKSARNTRDPGHCKNRGHRLLAADAFKPWPKSFGVGWDQVPAGKRHGPNEVHTAFRIDEAAIRDNEADAGYWPRR